jgi:hypothetical protein
MMNRQDNEAAIAAVVLVALTFFVIWFVEHFCP